MGLPVMIGDALAQGRQAESLGIAQGIAVQSRPRRRQHPGGRLPRRLAQFQMQHRMALCCAPVGGAQHIHDDERRNRAASGDFEAHGAQSLPTTADMPKPRGSAATWQRWKLGRPLAHCTALTRPGKASALT